MIIEIYESLLDEAKKQLERIARKAQKIGLPFEYAIASEPHKKQVVEYAYDDINYCTYEANRYFVSAVDVTIDESIIRRNGWTAIAQIEHTENGNIVTAFGGVDIDNKYQSCPPNCEHCKINRYRKITYLVRNDDGNIKQVGKGCLTEYTGINPQAAIAFAQVVNSLQSDFARYADCEDDGYIKSARVFDTLDAVAQATQSVAKFGYVISSDPYSTKKDTFLRLLDKTDYSADSEATAQKIINWINSTDDFCDNYLNNCKTICARDFVYPKHLGYIAYLPVAYQKHLDEEAKKQAQAAQSAKSDYVGTIKQRITFDVSDIRLLTSWDNGYGGVVYLYRIIDTQGNIFIWRASNAIEDRAKIKSITGTIKAHEEYRGAKQTVITRCKTA